MIKRIVELYRRSGPFTRGLVNGLGIVLAVVLVMPPLLRLAEWWWHLWGLGQ